MSFSLFVAIVALIVIFAIVTTAAFGFYMHFYTKYMMKLQAKLVSDMLEDDEDIAGPDLKLVHPVDGSPFKN